VRAYEAREAAVDGAAAAHSAGTVSGRDPGKT